MPAYNQLEFFTVPFLLNSQPIKVWMRSGANQAVYWAS